MTSKRIQLPFLSSNFYQTRLRIQVIECGQSTKIIVIVFSCRKRGATIAFSHRCSKILYVCSKSLNFSNFLHNFCHYHYNKIGLAYNSIFVDLKQKMFFYGNLCFQKVFVTSYNVRKDTKTNRFTSAFQRGKQLLFKIRIERGNLLDINSNS